MAEQRTSFRTLVVALRAGLEGVQWRPIDKASPNIQVEVEKPVRENSAALVEAIEEGTPAISFDPSLENYFSTFGYDELILAAKDKSELKTLAKNALHWKTKA